MLKKIAILANGGDVAGFNAVIRGIVKTLRICTPVYCNFKIHFLF